MLLENAQELKEINNAFNERFRTGIMGYLGQEDDDDEEDFDDDVDDAADDHHHHHHVFEEDYEEEAEYDEPSHFDGEGKPLLLSCTCTSGSP